MPALLPKVSIITVSFNSASTIEETILSVVNQTYKNIEYIVVDGNSTDETKSIIEKYRSHISIFISEPDKGIYDAMNKGVESSTGDIVAILNSDDFYLDNDVIKKIVDAFSQYESTQIVSTSVEIFNADTNKVIRKYNAKKFRNWMFYIGHQPPHPGIFCRRNVFDKTGLFHIYFKIAADFDFLLRAIQIQKLKIIKLDWTSVKMRAGGASQQGVLGIFKTNKEVYQSLKENEMRVIYPMVYLKYVFKIFQFLT